jgi:hypothetical protein
VSVSPIQVAPRGTPLSSDPAARLLVTLATEGPIRVEVVVRRVAGGWAVEATGWLADEDPAWPASLETVGRCADRAALVAALSDLMAAAFHHGAAVQAVRGWPQAVRDFGRAAARASERRYRRLPAEARAAPWERTVWLGADPPREGVRIKTWHSRLRELAGEPERGQP